MSKFTTYAFRAMAAPGKNFIVSGASWLPPTTDVEKNEKYKSLMKGGKQKLKGTLLNIWIKSLKKLYGEKTVEEAKQNSSLSEGLIITPLMDIPEDEAFDLVKSVAEKEGLSEKEIWRSIGEENINSFADWFPSYFEGRQLKNFLEMMDTVHKQLTDMIEGANPPRIIPEVTDDNILRLTYRSSRGLFDYFLGLLAGSREFFDEEMEVKEISRSETGNQKELVVDVIFARDFRTRKSFFLNRFLSLGIFKSLSSKIALGVFITTTAILGFSGAYEALWFPPALGFVNAFLIYALHSGLLKPLGFLQGELDRIKKLNLEEATSINTGDEFETVFEELQDIKEEIREDILFLKGGTDDMSSFTADFVEVAEEMNSVSDNISRVVDDVAHGAQEQAEETEDSAYIVDQNVAQIEELVSAGNESKELLENAVNSIQNSAEQVAEVNEMIADIRDSFANVNEQGRELANQIEDIMEIVETVSEIASQTNLLSLNASIEAARSQENSQGFTVVADEIRDLAEDSRQAGERIQDNLQQFTEEVQSLVNGISAQFENLEKSNKALTDVTEANRQASDNIEQTSQQIMEIVENLNSETQKVKEVIENLNSLAAIAEENSASAQQMSASVDDYSEKIKEMTGYIEQMEELVETFQANFADYNI